MQFRAIQDARKKLNLSLKDTAVLMYDGGEKEKEVLGRHEDRIRKTTLIRELRREKSIDGESAAGKDG